ncbi:MAG: hypothetical protein Q4A70_00495 [Candidatus Saccharibacteria bacterium]|nr:hypothetical protein [Candidatus Saccharibacteria bacterium]
MRVINFFETKHKQLLSVISAGLIIVGVSSPFTHYASATSIPNEITVTYPYYGFVENPDHPWETVFDALDETGTINYSDTYFDEPSPGDHPKLRAVSYALALAGYENQADGYPFDPSTPNPKLYNLLNQLGFSDHESWDISSEADGHSMGTTIAYKTLPSGQELIVVAPRNYNYMTEWLSNFNVGTAGDHAGFSESANRIIDRFNQYVTDHNFTNYKTWAVGYSRGGAVIDLFGKAVNANLADYQMSPDDFYVYTFGAPRASTVVTNCTNIHDVKDGNDLLLGYVFPELWGFYNTGTYEEIHPADLDITTSMVSIADLADPARAINVLSDNVSLTEDVTTMNGRDFMDDWFQFVTDHGLTREYFDTTVKAPLSAIMKIYQMRTIDRQSELTDFIKNTDGGLAGMVAGNALMDLMMGGYGTDIESSLANFPVYQDLVKILKGTATDADVDELLTKLTTYMGNYGDYEAMFGETPSITEDEFNVIKTNLPELVRALAPILIADAKYTQETFGEDYTLYYTYSIGKNAEKLVIGHIPESIMPILKSLIPEDDIDVPNSGVGGRIDSIGATVTSTGIFGESVIASLFGAILSVVFLGCKVGQRKSQPVL